MDISKKYIEMCQKAQEIQDYKEEINYQEGDFYTNVKYDNSYKINIASQMDEYIEGFNWWLPRQDQLQTMIEGNLMEKLNRFNKFLLPPFFKIDDNIDSKILEDFRKAWREQIEYHNNDLKIPIVESDDINIINIGVSDFNSFEQLWLAFVMKEKYNKIWEENNWITIKS